ncbi:MAG: helix-turn-helix domain-containing protein [Phycisphaerales bacterium JB039]
MRQHELIEPHPASRRSLRFASSDEMVSARLRIVCESMRIAEVARRTGAHPETVRRYMSGHAASVSFLVRFCEVMDISADWLLLGRGAAGRAEAMEERLAQATAQDLCAALAARIERGAPAPRAGAPRLATEEG